MTSIRTWGALLLAALMITGCSMGSGSGLKYEPVRLHPSKADAEIEDLGQAIYEAAGVGGKITQMGGLINEYEDIDRGYWLRSSWSIYNLSKGEFHEGYDHLREELPKHGWEVVKDGRDTTTAAKDPQLIVVHGDGASAYRAIIDYWVDEDGEPAEGVPTPDKPVSDIISVIVTSPVFVAPEGVDLSDPFGA